jgi:hypothetical protein
MYHFLMFIVCIHLLFFILYPLITPLTIVKIKCYVCCKWCKRDDCTFFFRSLWWYLVGFCILTRIPTDGQTTGGRNIYPARPTSTHSNCFFTISVSRCRFGTQKKPRKTHIYSLLLHHEFNLIFHTQLIGF